MSTPSGRGRLRAFFAQPHVAVFFVSAMLGRLSYATVGFALILRVQSVTGSYSAAAAAAVGYGLTAALLAPVRARLVDRWGRRRTLPPLAVGTVAVLASIALIGQPPGGARPWLIGMAGLAGCLLPPLGPVTRGVWADVASDDGELRTAYSLDTVAEEGLFTIGPLLVGVVVAIADARAALLLTALLMLVGTSGMVRSPLMCDAVPLPHTGDEVSPALPAASLLRRRVFATLLLVLFGVGAALGGVELAAIAVARGQLNGGPASTGAVLAALSLGSAAGGTAYGVRSWRGGATEHLVVLCGLLAVGLAVLATMSGAPLLGFGVAAFAVGLCISPLLVAAYTSADDVSDIGTRTQASTLIGTVNNLGIAAGTAVTGLLLDHGDPRRALLVSSLAMGATTAAAVAHRSIYTAETADATTVDT
jgi:MFS family permease